VLLFSTDDDGTCEFAYAVGCKHRGQALSARSVRGVLPVAREAGYRRARLRVAVDNLPSQLVAAAAGFTLTDEPLLRREHKGISCTWPPGAVRSCSLTGAPAGSTGTSALLRIHAKRHWSCDR
jgi:hypothetical protein